MMRHLIAVALVLLPAAACKKDAAPAETKAPPAAATVGKDGLRHIPIEASTEGYKPDRVAGKPGEKLTLVFTRVADGECISQVKVAAGPLVDLPKNTPVEIAVTVPQSGEIGFACGMDMFHGVVVADPSS